MNGKEHINALCIVEIASSGAIFPFVDYSSAMLE